MTFFTEEQRQKLLENGHNCDQDHAPVVKLHLPGMPCVWLLSELEPEDPEIAFGLCDLGVGYPELGSVWLPELAALNLREITVRRDDRFRPEFPMSVYAEAARNLQAITEDRYALLHAKEALKAKRRRLMP